MVEQMPPQQMIQDEEAAEFSHREKLEIAPKRFLAKQRSFVDDHLNAIASRILGLGGGIVLFVNGFGMQDKTWMIAGGAMLATSLASEVWHANTRDEKKMNAEYLAKIEDDLREPQFTPPSVPETAREFEETPKASYPVGKALHDDNAEQTQVTLSNSNNDDMPQAAYPSGEPPSDYSGYRGIDNKNQHLSGK